MEIHEAKNFIKSIHPFENLSKNELDIFAKNLDIIYLKKDEIIQKKSQKPEFLYFIIKGLVQEKSDDEVNTLHSSNDIFDAMSLLENYSKYDYITAEETICYILPRNVFIKVLRENKDLESYFFQSISQKLNNNIHNEKNKELSNIMLASVKDARIHKSVIVPFTTSIYEAAKIIKKEKVPTLLLEDENENMFIVTDSDFREKVILNRMSYDDEVGKISNPGLIYVYENDYLFNAQLIMAKHSLKRLVVKNDKNEIIGIIDQISLSSFFATNTFSVSNEIDKADTVEELKSASKAFIKIIKTLNAKGVKIDFISNLISQLNKRVLDKLFHILAPKELIDNCALVVMGSEGRREQVLKTDQDNALIISDACTLSKKEIEEFTCKYIDTLVDFGYPRCEGNIMISNPYWCRSQKEFKDLIFSWITSPNGESFMNLAIFYDALCVSGNKNLLKELKEYIFKIGSTSQTFYMHFAKVIMDFSVPLGFFDGFVLDNKNEKHSNEIDIKKGGIFILVQGIRTLSLEHKLFKTNTIKRIKALEKLGVLENEFSKELIEAFNFLSTIKLQSGLDKLDQRKHINNYINPKDLNTMQKDLLKDSFKIVNKLKKKLELYYKLNYA
ncbi:MAG: cyclic nucleotide-binding domain-containing protein [Campylobacteraceae bacterium]|nr:cyclic nucleotide-binding domain-containing protein [Campylobacteraceae bacterium]